MTSYGAKKDITSFLLYVFGFILLWEWVRPLEELTDTGNIEVFIIYLGLAMLLSFLGVRFWVAFLINGVYILVILKKLYFEGPFFNFSWVMPFLQDLGANFSVLIKWDIGFLSDMFRSLLFFLLLSIMVYLLRYWMFNKRQIIVYLVLTLVYITVLDTFTAYQGNGPIVRVVFIGFLLMGMLTYFRMIDKEVIEITRKQISLWMTGLVSLIIISVGIGYYAPKQAPLWPDPVPYLKAFMDKNDNEESQIGIGKDDSQLGGPLKLDNTVVFYAEVYSRNYWKVETKDVYTGKGWETSIENKNGQHFNQRVLPPVSAFSANVETERESAKITFKNNSDYLIYPNGVRWFLAEPGITFKMAAATERITPIKMDSPTSVKNFSVTYDVPKYSVSQLMNAQTSNLNEVSASFISRYTQLPKSLPPRVSALAQDITAGKTTWFEKAKAIEKYFGSSDFVYDQVNVLMPGEDDDYVDQFLFDSKRGYCNNFSTSMVVMLRSLGIPSRWVKGYTEGEFIRSGDDGARVFKITNNNAHSWVEVYFPAVGWVPFEPTKSFSNNVLFNYDTYKQEENPAGEDLVIPESEVEEKQEPKQKETSDKDESFSLKNLVSIIKEWIAKQLKWFVLICVLIVTIVFYVYRTRRKWLPYYYLWKFSHKHEDETFIKAYNVLIKQYERLGIKRKDDQTLRSYAWYIDRNFSTEDMSRLTSRYEEYIYKGSLQNGTWKELRDLWKNLIKMTIA